MSKSRLPCCALFGLAVIAALAGCGGSGGGGVATQSVPAATPMSFTTAPGALPAGTVGAAYPSTTIAVAGGSGLKTFTVTSGSLPAGLTISGSGAISGTPSGPAGTSNFTVQVQDQTGASGAISGGFTIAISAPPMSFTTAPGALPAGTVGAAYPSTTIAVAGGSGAKTFTVTNGSLPAGLTMSASGAISGTPAGPAGTSNFTVQVQDQTGASGTISGGFSIAITSPPQVISASPSSVAIGTSSTTVTLTGSGFVPATTVYLSGTAQPTTYISAQSVSIVLGPQSYLGSISVTVGNGGVTSNALTLPVVNAAPTLTSISPATVVAGTSGFSLTLTGTGLVSGSTALVNGVSYPLLFGGTTGTFVTGVDASQIAAVGSLTVALVNPAPGGGSSEVQTLQVVSADNRLRTLNYPTQDIVLDPVRTLLYASVGSGAATNPNSVVAIDPLQGTVVTAHTMPSQPGQLAVTGDGSYLYVSLPATGQVSRLLLPSLTPDIQWTLGYTPEDIEAAPGAPHTVAVTGVPGSAGAGTSSVAIWDDGVERKLIPATGYPGPSYDAVAWGQDATSLYATTSVSSAGDEYVFAVGANGPTLSATLPSVLGAFSNRLLFNQTNGDLYDEAGVAANAATGSLAGSFHVQSSQSQAIDTADGRTFFLTGNGPTTGVSGPVSYIQAFDLSKYTYLNSIFPADLSGTKIVQWGTSGLAVGGGTQIYILDGAFVSPSGVTSAIGSYVAESPTLTSISPQTVRAGSGDTVLTLTGQNINQAAAVTWNGQSIPFTWQSSTQGTATVPAALLTQAATAPILLSNGVGTERAPGQPFTVLPDLGPNTLITAMDLSGEDMVWDPSRSLLYVASTNPAAINGNSIAVVDPAATAIDNVVYTGGQPASLGLSDDGAYLYAGFETQASVERFALPGFTLNLTVPLNSGFPGESYAADVKVAPGQNQTIAVTMGNINTEPRGAGGVAIFDNATQRPKTQPYNGPGDVFKLTWGKDATRIYGQSDPDITPQTSSMLTVDSTGIAGRNPDGGPVGYILLRPHYDAGAHLVYSDGGEIINPATGAEAGAFPSSGLMVPDSTLNRAFFLRQNPNFAFSYYNVDVYNLSTQTLIKTIPVGNISGYPTQFVRWGSQGLAILTDSQNSPVGMIYFLQGSDISGASTPPAGAITLSPARVVEGTATGTAITVTGSGFVATSEVLVNGMPRKTTWVSATQLTFQLTVADQASSNYLAVAVTNAAAAGSTTPAATLEVDNPVPAIAGLSPATVPAGSGNVTVTVTGIGFDAGTTVQFNGSARTTAYVNSTQVTVLLYSTDLTGTGNFAITATDPGPGGGTSAAATLAVVNPTPAITGLSPSVVAVGSAGQAVGVFGSGFIASTVVQVNGTARPTTFVNSTSLIVPLTAADFATAGSVSFVAVNPLPGGGPSAAASLAVNPGIPGAIALFPSSVLQGAGAPTTVTVTGSNFEQGCTVKVNSSSRATTFVSATEVTFQLTVADQVTVGTRTITVVNPPPGGTSPAAALTVAAPVVTPTITSVSPSPLVVGSGQTSINVAGTGFTSSSTVSWNGTPLSTTYFNPVALFAQVPGSLLTSVGTTSLTVNTPTAMPSLSNAFQVSIVAPPAPTLTSISPAFGPIGIAFTETLTGTGFTASSVVSVNGTALPTTFVSSTQLTAALAANQVLPGNSSFTVTTPAPGGGVSAAALFTAYVAIANNSMIYNPTTGLFYLSVPSSAGAPYGNSVVSLDPVTGALGTPIFVGSEPNRLAITSDGRYLWVGLDGAQAVRKVDLLAGAAGLQFPIPPYSSTYSSYPLTAFALAAVPGQTDSVAVAAAASGGTYSTLAIFDGGVVRGGTLTLFSSGIYSLQIDGTRDELYAAGGSFGVYGTYTYSSSGLTQKLFESTGTGLANNIEDRIQLASGRIYTDHGIVYDAESGTLLGAFSAQNTYFAYSESVAIDATLGLAFLLESSTTYSTPPAQIQIFNLSGFASAGTATVPVNVATNGLGEPVAPGTRMMRWGTDGLAFRNSVSVYTLRSNLVENLAASPADLAVTLASPSGGATGAQTTSIATVTNAGPAAASEVGLTATAPSTGTVVSAAPSVGTCSIAPVIACDLGTLASGAAATVSVVVAQLTAGASTMQVQVSASQPDPNLGNNQASATTTVAGATNAPVPTLASATPAAVLAGSTDTVVTLTGTGFGAGTIVLIDGATLPTTVVSATQATTTVPAASLSALGWHQLTVSNPAPGGGVSGALPLSVYSVIKAGANHIVYEPFTRQILATLGPSTATGNSVEGLTPASGAVSTPPVFVGSEPTSMALSDDGRYVYVRATGSGQIVRYNLITQQPEFSYSVSGATLGFAVQTGSDNTLAVSGSPSGVSIVDFDPVARTATARPSTAANLSSAGVQFLDSGDVIAGAASGEQFARYTVSSSGLSASPTSYAPGDTALFKLANGLAFTGSGEVANVTSQPGTLAGSIPVVAPSSLAAVAPDPAIGRVFYLSSQSQASYLPGGLSGIAAFDTNTFMAACFVPLNISAIEATASTAVDVVRWGQDGVAALTSGGNIYLVRGGAVLPQLLQANIAPALGTSSPGALQHGSGNTVLTLAGSNFLPGVAVFWNGSYRTTNLISATQITVDIPAADLTSPGTANLTVANPGSASSPSIALAVN